LSYFCVAAATHRGLYRQSNEDWFGASGLTPRLHDGEVAIAAVSGDVCLAVVADGVGGRPCGEVASRVAVDAFLDAAAATPEELVAAIHAANEAVVAAMDGSAGSIGMGTTVAAVMIHASGVSVANVGDSAVLEVTDTVLAQHSTDDLAGRSSRVPGIPSGALTQVLGGSAELVPVTPHLHTDHRSGHRRLLLCTDGLTSFVPRHDVAAALRLLDPAAAVDALIGLALAAGAPDNVTVVLVDSEPDSP